MFRFTTTRSAAVLTVMVMGLVPGCGGNGADDAAGGDQTPAVPLASGSAPNAAPKTPGEDSAAAAAQPANIGVPQPGDPGLITGKLKSSYIRLAPAVVYVEQVEPGEQVMGGSFHPPAEAPVMGQKDKIFKPHILPVVVGTTVDFTNNDDVKHNVFSRPSSPAEFNLGEYAPGVVKRVTFDEVGVTHLGCRVHAEMSGYIVTLQNPYFAVTERDGTFMIPDVPPGVYRLTFFHERIGEKVIDVTVRPGTTTEVEFTGLKRK